MPGQDQTGPMGQGPRTGGGFGRCNPNYASAADGTPLMGVGRGGRPMGGGRGRCWGGGRAGQARFDQSASSQPATEAAQLRDKVRALTAEVAQLRAELNARQQNEGGSQ